MRGHVPHCYVKNTIDAMSQGDKWAEAEKGISKQNKGLSRPFFVAPHQRAQNSIQDVHVAQHPGER